MALTVERVTCFTGTANINKPFHYELIQESLVGLFIVCERPLLYIISRVLVYRHIDNNIPFAKFRSEMQMQLILLNNLYVSLS